jgi:8-oxo-dGTP diphosphatase
MIKAGNQPIKVVCAIIEQGKTFLAAQRNSNDSQALLWEFPGGKVGENESSQEALIREINEELGVKVSVGLQLETSVHRYPDKVIELIPFVCTISEGTPSPIEHAAIAWLTAEEAEKLSWAPADIPILNNYANRSSTGYNY